VVAWLLHLHATDASGRAGGATGGARQLTSMRLVWRYRNLRTEKTANRAASNLAADGLHFSLLVSCVGGYTGNVAVQATVEVLPDTACYWVVFSFASRWLLSSISPRHAAFLEETRAVIIVEVVSQSRNALRQVTILLALTHHTCC